MAIDADDIGGVVTGPEGPEAGVWVIAETRDLPVRYIQIVVTDDRGLAQRDEEQRLRRLSPVRSALDADLSTVTRTDLGSRRTSS